MSRGINYAGNVGWTLWNYSKRISAVKYEARGAQKLFDSHAAMNDWPIEDLYDLRDLTNQLQDCAERADETWRKLQEAVNENDSDLIELRERIRMIYGADTSDADSQKLATSIESLRAKVRKEQGTRSTPT